MSYFSSAPFSNVTTYKKEFVGTVCPRRPLTQFFPQLENPVVGGLEEHVLPRSRYEKLPCTQTKYPEPKKYAEEVEEKYPATRVLLRDGNPLDLDVVDKLYVDENRSVYMISYCEREDYDSKNTRLRRRHALPDDWEIPRTTYTCAFRHPELMAGGAMKILNARRDNLCPCVKEKHTSSMRTGETIYNTDFNRIGAEIIKGKLHGDINIRPQFDEEDLLKTKLLRRD